MSRMTGIEFLEQVRGNYPALPFIMVMANRDGDSVKAARGLGVNAFIAKPYAPERSESKATALARQLRAANILAAGLKIPACWVCLKGASMPICA